MFFKTILNVLALTLTFNLMALGTAIALPRNINTVLDKLTELGTLEGKVDKQLQSWTGEHTAAIPLLNAIQAWGDGMMATTVATEEIKGPFHEADSKQVKDITVGMGNAMPKTFELFLKKVCFSFFLLPSSFFLSFCLWRDRSKSYTNKSRNKISRRLISAASSTST